MCNSDTPVITHYQRGTSHGRSEQVAQGELDKKLEEFGSERSSSPTRLGMWCHRECVGPPTSGRPKHWQPSYRLRTLVPPSMSPPPSSPAFDFLPGGHLGPPPSVR